MSLWPEWLLLSLPVRRNAQILVGCLLGGWNQVQNSVTQQVLLLMVAIVQLLYLLLLQVSAPPSTSA